LYQQFKTNKFSIMITNPKEFTKWQNKANKLYNTLLSNAKLKPNKFCENYGQKEVRAFEDKLNQTTLSYQEKSAIKDSMIKISSISPY
jgi:hypothetical protein